MKEYAGKELGAAKESHLYAMGEAAHKQARKSGAIGIQSF